MKDTLLSAAAAIPLRLQTLTHPFTSSTVRGRAIGLARPGAQQLDGLVNALIMTRADLTSLRKKAAATRDETGKRQIDAGIGSLNGHVEELLARLE